MYGRAWTRTAAAVTLLSIASVSQAQTEHQHEHMAAAPSSGWAFMQDGVVFGLFNHQGGPSGGDEFVVPNWWMGMASRPVRKSTLTLSAMFSLDAATVGTRGYREIF